MPLLARLDRGICRLRSWSAWWERELGEDAEGRNINEGDGFGGEFFFLGKEDFLDCGVRGLDPVGCKRCHLRCIRVVMCELLLLKI